jgi:hypothetical protein
VILCENLLDDMIELFHLRLQRGPSTSEIALKAENLAVDSQSVKNATVDNGENSLNRRAIM